MRILKASRYCMVIVNMKMLHYLADVAHYSTATNVRITMNLAKRISQF